MYCCNNLTLPDFYMTAGESKNISIPLYNCSRQQIDATGMYGRFAICDFVNTNMAPIKCLDCSAATQDGEQGEEVYVILVVDLAPEDTVNLSGKYIYQVTGKDSDGNFGVMRGNMIIYPNQDKDALKVL